MFAHVEQKHRAINVLMRRLNYTKLQENHCFHFKFCAILLQNEAVKTPVNVHPFIKCADPCCITGCELYNRLFGLARIGNGLARINYNGLARIYNGLARIFNGLAYHKMINTRDIAIKKCFMKQISIV